MPNLEEFGALSPSEFRKKLILDLGDLSPARQTQWLAEFWRAARKMVGMTVDELNLQPRLIERLSEDLNPKNGPKIDYLCSLQQVNNLIRLTSHRLNCRPGIGPKFVDKIEAALSDMSLTLAQRTERTEHPLMIDDMDIEEPIKDALKSDVRDKKTNKYRPEPYLRPMLTMPDIQAIGLSGLVLRPGIGPASVKKIEYWFDSENRLLPP